MIGIYIRVSSREQVETGYSLQTQRERLTAFCSANGWENYKFFVEEGKSAKNDKRPEYQNMMAAVKAGKIKTVLVYRLDRIMRSIGDLHQMLKTFNDYDCSFKSATEPFDTTNATGKLFIYIVGALAQWENELKSERIKEVLAEKVANEGVWIGNVPYSFDKDKSTQKLVPNERRIKVTLKMIELLKKGWSSVRIADYLNENNNDRNWHHNAILRILRNPALCGHTTWNDETYRNTHKGIITQEEFDHIQSIFDERTITRVRTIQSVAIFQGKMVCPSCSRIMTINRYYRTRADRTKIQGSVYKCNPCAKDKRFNKSPSENSILAAVYTYMRNVKINIENVKIKDDEPDYVFELKTIENKRSKYQRAWANDLMTDDEFRLRMDETREIYEDLQKKIKTNRPSEPIDPAKIKNVILMFNNNFKELTKQEKRDFISVFVKNVYFEIVPQPPRNPDKAKRGRDKVRITNVDFY